jgi:hypothetical protein
VDERPFNMVRRLIEETKPEHMPSIAVLKAAIKRQAFVLALDEERALAALPKLAPDRELRRRGYEAARKALGARGEPAPDQVERLRRVAAVLGLDQPVQELKPDEPRQIQAPDRSGTGTRARSDRGRTPM